MRNGSLTDALSFSEAGGDILRLHEFRDAMMPSTLAAKAALLDAAEGRCRVGDQAAVEADHAGFHLRGNAHALGNVLRINVSGETIFGVVCALDRLGLGVEDRERCDRPEDFLMGHACI